MLHQEDTFHFLNRFLIIMQNNLFHRLPLVTRSRYLLKHKGFLHDDSHCQHISALQTRHYQTLSVLFPLLQWLVQFFFHHGYQLRKWRDRSLKTVATCPRIAFSSSTFHFTRKFENCQHITRFVRVSKKIPQSQMTLRTKLWFVFFWRPYSVASSWHCQLFFCLFHSFILFT